MELSAVQLQAELAKEQAERKAAFLLEWVMVTPYGPMRHRDTGEGYWEHNVRLEQEARAK